MVVTNRITYQDLVTIGTSMVVFHDYKAVVEEPISKDVVRLPTFVCKEDEQVAIDRMVMVIGFIQAFDLITRR